MSQCVETQQDRETGQRQKKPMGTDNGMDDHPKATSLSKVDCMLQDGQTVVRCNTYQHAEQEFSYIYHDFFLPRETLSTGPLSLLCTRNDHYVVKHYPKETSHSGR